MNQNLEKILGTGPKTRFQNEKKPKKHVFFMNDVSPHAKAKKNCLEGMIYN
jgi:hypothetical protein